MIDPTTIERKEVAEVPGQLAPMLAEDFDGIIEFLSTVGADDLLIRAVDKILLRDYYNLAR